MATVAVVFLALSRMTNEVNQIDRDVVRRSLSAAVAETFPADRGHPEGLRQLERGRPRALRRARPGLRPGEHHRSTASGDVFEHRLPPGGRRADRVRILRRRADRTTRRELLQGRLPAARGADGTHRSHRAGAGGHLHDAKGIVLAAVGAVLPSDGSTVRPKGPPRLLLVGRNARRCRDQANRDGLRHRRPDPVMDQSGAGFDLTTRRHPHRDASARDARHPGDEAYDRARTPMMVVLGLPDAGVDLPGGDIWKTLSAMHRGEELARREAGLDGLSGLPNRASFHTAVEQAVGGEGHRTVTVLFADLDGFKDVNDTTATRRRPPHSGGGGRLREPRRTRRISRPARRRRVRGGVHRPGLAGGGHPFGAALIDLLSEPFDFDGRVVQVGTSVGIANTASERLTASELVRRADVAMYQAKSRGKNRVETYDPEMDGEADGTRQAGGRAAQRLPQRGAPGPLPARDRRPHRAHRLRGGALALDPGVGGPVSPAVVHPDRRGDRPDRGPRGRGVLPSRLPRRRRLPGPARRRQHLRGPVSNPGFDQVVARVLAEEGFPASRLELDITGATLSPIRNAPGA